MNNDKTLDYYNENADKFVSSTVDVTFNTTQDKFLNLLQPKSYILDYGCGSGRDTKYFLDKGYQVDAIDGSTMMVKYASELTGIQVKEMLFQDLDEEEKYDGIWACSSILHLNKEQLEDVFPKMIRALKKEGIIYTSFKYGTYEGERNGRYFTDFNEVSFNSFLKEFPQLSLQEQWISGDVRPGRENEKWLNLILKKQ